MATPIKVVLTKKPDDWCLRASLGGNDGIGYYCVYRGNLRMISLMLTYVQQAVSARIKMGGEPALQPEDDKHTSPGSMEKKELFDKFSAMLVAEVKRHNGIPELSLEELELRDALAKYLLT